MVDRIGSYELNQSTCFVNDNYDVSQLSSFISHNLVPYLKNINSSDYLKINIIGSPSDAGFVFKLSIKGITINDIDVNQCYALKIMPYTNTYPDNRNELYFADFFSKKNDNNFAVVYYQEENVNLRRSPNFEIENEEIRCITDIPIKDWYKGSNSSIKIEKHTKIYENVIEYNDSQEPKYSKEIFLCDIMVSRLYWGDLISFINNIIEVKSPEKNEINRCENNDFCGVLNEIKINVSDWKSMLLKILDTVKIMREDNVIHNDLHCGNILLDFNGTPVIHDFGLTRMYLPPINDIQLYFGDTCDFSKLINAIEQETRNGTLNPEVTAYLINVRDKFNAYIMTLYNVNTPIEHIGMTSLRLRRQHENIELTEEFKLKRNILFDNLKEIILSDVEVEEFNIKVELAKLDIVSDMTYNNFKLLKRRYMSDQDQTKVAVYRKILKWWDEHREIEVKFSGGEILKLKKRINKKYKYIKTRKIKKPMKTRKIKKPMKTRKIKKTRKT